MAILAGAVTVGLLVTGIAFAAQDVDESTVNVSLAESQTLTIPVDNASVIVLSRANNGSTSSTGVTSSPGSTSVTGSTSPTSTSSTAPTSTTATVNGSGNLVLAEGQVSQVPVADAGSVLLRRSGGSLTIVSTESNPGWVVEVEVATGREVEGDFRSGSRRVKFNFELEDGVVRMRIDSDGSASGGSSTTRTTGGSSLPTGTVTYNLDGAGTVTVIFSNGGMTIGSINPAVGWTIEDSEQKFDEIEVELTNGDAEAELKVKVNNGVLEVEIDSKSRQ
jgi:frataxin-like iron-binding protein CyaY